MPGVNHTSSSSPVDSKLSQSVSSSSTGKIGGKVIENQKGQSPKPKDKGNEKVTFSNSAEIKAAPKEQPIKTHYKSKPRQAKLPDRLPAENIDISDIPVEKKPQLKEIPHQSIEQPRGATPKKPSSAVKPLKAPKVYVPMSPIAEIAKHPHMQFLQQKMENAPSNEMRSVIQDFMDQMSATLYEIMITQEDKPTDSANVSSKAAERFDALVEVSKLYVEGYELRESLAAMFKKDPDVSDPELTMTLDPVLGDIVNKLINDLAALSTGKLAKDFDEYDYFKDTGKAKGLSFEATIPQVRKDIADIKSLLSAKNPKELAEVMKRLGMKPSKTKITNTILPLK